MEKFYELVQEWDMKNTKELTLGIGDYNGHVGKEIDEFEGVHEEMEMGSETLKEECCWKFAIKRIYE